MKKISLIGLVMILCLLTTVTASATLIYLNIDGNCSDTAENDEYYWSPHYTDLSSECVDWTFTHLATLELVAPDTEFGHLAAGSFWSTGFVSGERIPIYEGGQYKNLRLNFWVKVETFDDGDGWLRAGAVICINRTGNASTFDRYTEIDFCDSDTVNNTENPGYDYPIMWQGGNCAIIQAPQVTVGTWKHYNFNVIGAIDMAWGLYTDDVIESVYIVIETDYTDVEAVVKVDNFWLVEIT